MASPALINYLQRQNPSQGQIAGNPQQMTAPYNPYNEGIANAIASARASLGMTQDQQDTALQSALSAFGQNIGNQPRVKGFWQNLGQIGRAALPAIDTYNNEEANALAQNNQLANQILAHQAREEARVAQEEERAWRRDLMERQFKEATNQHAEQIRHHKALEGLREESIKAKKKQEQLGEEFPLIGTKSAFDRVAKETKGEAAFFDEVSQIKNKYSNLKKALEESGVDTTNPLTYNEAVRNASGFFSSFTKDPQQRKIAQLYEDLQATTLRAMQTAEKELKDGALTNFTVKYAENKKLFPNLAKENYDVFEKKLETMFENARDGYESSAASLKSGRHINKVNYPKYKKMIQETNPDYLPYLPESEGASEQLKRAPQNPMEQQAASPIQGGNNKEVWPIIYNTQNHQEQLEIHPEDLADYLKENPGWKTR